MRLFRVSSKTEARQTQLVAPISSARKDTPDADRRWPDSSLGKGYALPVTSSGAVLRGASDRRHGSSRCGPGADPPGAVGRQCVTVFTEELPWLQGRDLELVMGEALCNWVGWRLPG